MANWGEDELSKFYAIADGVAQDSYTGLSLAHAGHLAVHRAFRLTQDKPIPENISGVALLLFTNAHSMFLAAARAAVAGHAAAVYPLLRACLESALYGLHMAKHPNSETIWTERSKSKTKNRKCREEFSAANVKRTASESNDGLGHFANDIYEALIDYGAHPNLLGVFNHVSTEEGADVTKVRHTILWNNSMQSNEALVACYEVGIAALVAKTEAFPSWSEELGAIAATQKLWDEKDAKIDAMVQQSITLDQSHQESAGAV